MQKLLNIFQNCRKILNYLLLQLNQLIKGGRISKTKGLIGNIMKIKPIGTLREGYLEIVHNSRTQNSSIQYLKRNC